MWANYNAGTKSICRDGEKLVQGKEESEVMRKKLEEDKQNSPGQIRNQNNINMFNNRTEEVGRKGN